MDAINKTKWVMDPAHSEIQFRVRHLVIANVTGSFGKFEGTVETSRDDFSDAQVTFSADVESVSTNMPDRDVHLKSADFFDAANFPKLIFKSRKIEKKSENKYKLTGDITIRGITREFSLDVDYNGSMKDPFGNIKAGFEMRGELIRKDFGLQWNVVTEAGGLLVGDEVKIIINAELVKQ